MFKKIAIILLLTAPLMAWLFYKPLRVIAPEFNGMSCPEKYLCVDDVTKSSNAKKLYEETLLFVNTNVGKLNTKPLTIFCSTEKCSDAFGLGKRSAMHLPIGIVISPRAWKKHYVVHELIHQLQQQELGILFAFQNPKWYLEGMAYSLSADPRTELSEPFQQYRKDFNTWFLSVGKDNLWQIGKDF